MRLSDFKKLSVGGVELKQLFINGYKNWVPFAIDGASGNILTAWAIVMGIVFRPRAVCPRNQTLLRRVLFLVNPRMYLVWVV